MKVTVSCAGRFHAFDLAEQLYRRASLQQFITTTLNSGLIPNRALPDSLKGDRGFLDLVSQIPAPEYLCYAVRKLPIGDAQSLAYLIKDNLYDQAAVKRITKSDIFVGWASQSLFQLREAKTRGAKTIIERGSAHIEEQYRLIEAERKKFGVKSPSRSKFDDLLVEKQLKEYHESDRIMVPSEFARQSFILRGFDAKKILKVRYGVDLTRFYPSSNITLRTGAITILYVGAIGFQKGIPYLLEAVRDLRKSSAVKLKLIGRVESDFEQYLISSGLRGQVDEHLPFVAHSDLVHNFHEADIFCMPSVQEGLALVVAEALASGVPVVATTNSGASEFGESRALKIVPASDEVALAEALRTWADDPAALRSAKEAATGTVANCTWQHYGDEIIAAYEHVLNEAKAPVDTSTEIASFYDEYWQRDKGWTPTHSFTEDQLKLHFEGAFPREASVLDVGCGDASNYQSWLVGQVRHLAAIDISESGVAVARRMGLDAQVHDFAKTFPFPDNTFDGATCIEVLEHLYDPKFAVQEIFRVLKPGGLLVTSVPNNGYFRERLRALTKAELSVSITDFENEWKGAHIRFYSLHSFRRLFEVAGFRVERVSSNGDASIYDGADAFGGYWTQHATSLARLKLPRALKLSFLENVWPSLFAPHIVLRVRKPQ